MLSDISLIRFRWQSPNHFNWSGLDSTRIFFWVSFCDSRKKWMKWIKRHVLIRAFIKNLLIFHFLFYLYGPIITNSLLHFYLRFLFIYSYFWTITSDRNDFAAWSNTYYCNNKLYPNTEKLGYLIFYFCGFWCIRNIKDM